MACHAHAAPEGQQGRTDALLGLLQERGLVVQQAATQAVTQAATQVRNVASDLVVGAMNFIGLPYLRGGNSPEQGFDCSGFTRHLVQLTTGLVLPRRAEEQARAPGTSEVQPESLEPGDLVFFNTMKRAFSHVGIYVGDGKFIHSPRSGSEVRVEDMRMTYWKTRFDGARRLATEPDTRP